MKTKAERIAYVIQATGIKPAEFARMIGVSPQAVSDLQNGKSKGIKDDNLFIIEDKTGFLARWIVTGKGPMTIKDQREQHAAYVIEQKIKNHEILDITGLPEKSKTALETTLDALTGTGHVHSEPANYR